MEMGNTTGDVADAFEVCTRGCSRCRYTKPLTLDNFNAYKRLDTGLKRTCRACDQSRDTSLRLDGDGLSEGWDMSEPTEPVRNAGRYESDGWKETRVDKIEQQECLNACDRDPAFDPSPLGWERMLASATGVSFGFSREDYRISIK